MLPVKVLLVDDDSMCRQVMGYIFEDLGIAADIVGTTQEAFARLQAESYALIFADIGMPGMDGVTFARTVRESYTATTPIVATTGHVTQSDQASYLQAGIEHILEKPIRPSAIERFIQDYLRGPDCVKS